MTKHSEFKLAAVQAAPVYHDLDASTKKACELIREAASKGATLAAFGETWLPGYPYHVWLNPAAENKIKIRAEYLANAVEIPGSATNQLCDAARDSNVDVVIGVAERDSVTQGTVYCTLLFISNEGEILGRHRKLKPTDHERIAWGEGDGSGLVVYDRPYGKISGLNCWEHQMVLPGYALIAQGTQIHVAAWPGMTDSNHAVLSAALACQAAAYVIDVGCLLSPEDIPDKYEELKQQTVDYWGSLPGQSQVIDPWGGIIAGPAEGETILIAEGSTEVTQAAKTYCDSSGHYSRPDVFDFRVNRSPLPRMTEFSTE